MHNPEVFTSWLFGPFVFGGEDRPYPGFNAALLPRDDLTDNQKL